MSSVFAAHPCSVVGQTGCTESDCGDPSQYTSVCDRDGCDFNPFRMGNKSFYGPGASVDTNKPFSIVTQFITNNGTDSGILIEIRRFYVQNGITYQNPYVNVPGVNPHFNSITGAYCDQQKAAFNDTNSFQNRGGLKTMGEALARGVVLVFSLGDDYAGNMLWLDSEYPSDADPSKPGVARGTCSTGSG